MLWFLAPGNELLFPQILPFPPREMLCCGRCWIHPGSLYSFQLYGLTGVLGHPWGCPAAPQHPKLSRLILTDPFPANPHKATACPGAAASCPARGCPQGGFYSNPPSLLFSQFSVRVSAVNYICLSAQAANLLSPSGKREVRKQR